MKKDLGSLFYLWFIQTHQPRTAFYIALKTVMGGSDVFRNGPDVLLIAKINGMNSVVIS